MFYIIREILNIEDDPLDLHEDTFHFAVQNLWLRPLFFRIILIHSSTRNLQVMPHRLKC